MPNFFAALVLMYFLSVKLGWLPVVTSENTILSLVLPTLTLTVSMASKYTRQVRAAVLEELNKDYVMGARARGVSGKVIIWKNVMKASMVTIITLLSLSVGSLLGGTTIVETIFMWDGVGKMAVDRHHYERLSHCAGLCGLDGGDLCAGKSGVRYPLPLYRSPRKTGR